MRFILLVQCIDDIDFKISTHFVVVYIITLTLFMVSVQHDAEYNPYQTNDESDNTANQSNGSPRLHAQESSVVQIKNLRKAGVSNMLQHGLFTRKDHDSAHAR